MAPIIWRMSVDALGDARSHASGARSWLRVSAHPTPVTETSRRVALLPGRVLIAEMVSSASE